MTLFSIVLLFALVNIAHITVAKLQGKNITFNQFNACGLVGTSGTGDDCVVVSGGVKRSAVIDYADVASVTVDTDGNVTGIARVAGTNFVELTPDDDDTAFYNQTGTRDGLKHESEQTYFGKFSGHSVLKRTMGNNIKKCCALLHVILSNSGVMHVQGITTDGATQTYDTTKGKAKATVNYDTDTGDNAEKLEISIISTDTELSAHVVGTDFATLTGL